MATDRSEEVYESSSEQFRRPATVVVVVCVAFAAETLWGLLKQHTNPLVWWQGVSHLVFIALILALMAYIARVQTGRSVTVSNTQVVCSERGKSFSIPMSQLVMTGPKRGQKTKRSFVLTDGRKSFRVEEYWFPDFDDLLDQMKSLKR